MTELVKPHVVDRTGWEPGPWDLEPDRMEWIHAGFACIASRNGEGGWCGYVGVPESHPFFGKDSDKVDVDVHGGLTYASECQGHICHIPKPGMPDKVWWLGFDCCHLFDRVPGMEARHKKHGMLHRLWEPGSQYRNADYIKREVNQLAEQLRSIGHG